MKSLDFYPFGSKYIAVMVGVSIIALAFQDILFMPFGGLIMLFSICIIGRYYSKYLSKLEIYNSFFSVRSYWFDFFIFTTAFLVISWTIINNYGAYEEFWVLPLAYLSWDFYHKHKEKRRLKKRISEKIEKKRETNSELVGNWRDVTKLTSFHGVDFLPAIFSSNEQRHYLVGYLSKYYMKNEEKQKLAELSQSYLSAYFPEESRGYLVTKWILEKLLEDVDFVIYFSLIEFQNDLEEEKINSDYVLLLVEDFRKADRVDEKLRNLKRA